MSKSPPAFVVAVIVAFRRDAELQRLLAGLSGGDTQPGGIVVVDNAASPATQAIVAASGAEYIALPENPGPGTAWKAGCEFAIHHWSSELTHFLTLDDDVVFEKSTLSALLDGCTGAEVVVPMLTDHAGNIWGFPEPARRELRQPIRDAVTPADGVRLLGNAPLEFCWATGACVLFTRHAAEVTGWHRTDFFMLGEDLEWSMRAAAQVRAVFLPGVAVPHLPPVTATAPAAPSPFAWIKFCALLQNLSYLAFHHSDSAHMRRYLPGNFRRFFRTHGWNILTLRLALRTFIAGALLGRPAGTASGGRTRALILQNVLSSSAG